jgi:hypothetical protein
MFNVEEKKMTEGNLIRKRVINVSLRLLAAAIPFGTAPLIGYIYFGSISNTMAWLGGDRVWVSPQEIDLGKVEKGTRTVEVRLANFHGQTLQIVGGRGACKCISMPDLPIQFAPSAPAKLDLTVTIDGEASEDSGVVRQSFVLFTNVPGNERLEGFVTWRQ